MKISSSINYVLFLHAPVIHILIRPQDTRNPNRINIPLNLKVHSKVFTKIEVRLKALK